MSPGPRGLKHLFIPPDDPHRRKVNERASGDELRAAADWDPCEHCGATRVLDFKLAGVRCRGCGRGRVRPASPVPQETTVP